MKGFEFFSLLAFLLLVVEPFAASLLIRGRSKIEKFENRVPYMCLEVSGDLPTCNFDDGVDGEMMDKPLRTLRSLGLNTLGEARDMASFEHRPTTIVYKIERCIPHRLPLVLPMCEEKDSRGENVQVTKLFPFKPIGPLTEESDVLPPFIFPKINVDRWQWFTEQPPTSPADDVIDASQNVEITVGKNVALEDSVVATKKSSRWPDERSKINYARYIFRTMTNGQRVPKETDSNDNASDFPSSIASNQQQQQNQPEHHPVDDHVDHANSDASGNNSAPRKVDATEKNVDLRTIDPLLPKKLFTNDREIVELPYDEVSRDDSIKLRLSRSNVETSHPRVPTNDGTHTRHHVRDVPLLFPYAKAIPFDQAKLGPSRFTMERNLKSAVPVSRDSTSGKMIFDEPRKIGPFATHDTMAHLSRD